MGTPEGGRRSADRAPAPSPASSGGYSGAQPRALPLKGLRKGHVCLLVGEAASAFFCPPPPPPWLPGPRSQSQIGGAWLPSHTEGISRLEPQVLMEGNSVQGAGPGQCVLVSTRLPLQAGGQLLCPWALGRWPLASPRGGEGGSAQLAWVAAPWGPHSSMLPAAPSLRGAASSLQNQPTR